MQIDLERALGAPGQRGGVGERTVLQNEMLNRLALPHRQARERASDGAGRVYVSYPQRWIGRLIDMTFERERRVHLAHVLPAGAAQEIDRPPVGNDAQPRG